MHRLAEIETEVLKSTAKQEAVPAFMDTRDFTAFSRPMGPIQDLLPAQKVRHLQHSYCYLEAEERKQRIRICFISDESPTFFAFVTHRHVFNAHTFHDSIGGRRSRLPRFTTATGQSLVQ